jgi:hypothetical protein
MDAAIPSAFKLKDDTIIIPNYIPQNIKNLSEIQQLIINTIINESKISVKQLTNNIKKSDTITNLNYLIEKKTLAINDYPQIQT